MKNIKTFEEFSIFQFEQNIDESFLGFKNDEEKMNLTVTHMKGLLKYFISKNSVKNYIYWFDILIKNDLSKIKEHIRVKFDNLIAPLNPHIFGGKSEQVETKAMAKAILRNPNIYDVELINKIKEISSKLNYDPKLICSKLNLSC